MPQDLHVEAFGPARVPSQGVLRHQGSHDLLFVGLDKDARLQLRASRSLFDRSPVLPRGWQVSCRVHGCDVAGKSFQPV